MLCISLVGYLFNHVCDVHSRSRSIYQDRLHLPHSSNLWWRHRACHHERRHQKPGRTVRLLCSSRLLHMRGCLARLFGSFPCGESTSWSCARESCAIVIRFFAFYHSFPTEEETLFVGWTNGAEKRGWVRTPHNAGPRKEPATMMWYPSSLFIYIINFFGEGGRQGMGAFLPFLSVALVGRKINDRWYHTTVHVRGILIDTPCLR